MKISITSIQRNRNPWIVEWLAFHMLVGFNDFHGHLDPPKATTEITNATGEKIRVPSGGVAYLASAVDSLKAGQQNTVVVAAGDLIGASPLSFLRREAPHLRALVAEDVAEGF